MAIENDFGLGFGELGEDVVERLGGFVGAAGLGIEGHRGPDDLDAALVRVDPPRDLLDAPAQRLEIDLGPVHHTVAAVADLARQFAADGAGTQRAADGRGHLAPVFGIEALAQLLQLAEPQHGQLGLAVGGQIGQPLAGQACECLGVGEAAFGMSNAFMGVKRTEFARAEPQA